MAWRTAPWLIAAVLVVVGVSSTGAVTPLGSGAAPTEFSATRALEHVRTIARSPHPMGSAQIEEVRGYLVDELTSLGLEVDLQTVRAPDVFGTRGTVDVVNVIAWIPGEAHSRAVLLMAHYDTAPSTPGANDNSAGVAALLETARALRAGPALANDIVFLFTDGEEPSGRYGSRAFASVPGLVDRLGLVVNLEANGSTGASLVVETGGPESWLIDQYASLSSHPAAFSFLPETAKLLGDIGTDFDVFRNAGVPGFHFAYLRGSSIYHTPADDIASVDAGAVQHHGSQALAIARRFGDLDLGVPPPSGSSVYFTVGRFVLAYPEPWSLPLALVAVAALVVALSPARRPRPLELPRLMPTAGAHAAAAAIAAVAGTVLWALATALESSPVIPESYASGLLIAALAIIAGRWIMLRLGGGDPPTRAYGSVVVWVALAVVTAGTAPGFSYLFIWPALAGAVCLWWRPHSRPGRLAQFSVVAATAVLVTVPAIDVFFMLAQPRPGNPDSQLTAAAAVPLLLTFLVVGLMTGVWPDEAQAHRCAATAPDASWRSPPAPSQPRQVV